MLKGSDVFLSQNINECFDGLLAKVIVGDKWQFIMPNSIVQFLGINYSHEVFIYVEKAEYISIKGVN